MAPTAIKMSARKKNEDYQVKLRTKRDFADEVDRLRSELLLLRAGHEGELPSTVEPNQDQSSDSLTSPTRKSASPTSSTTAKFPDVGQFTGEGSETGLAYISRFESAAEAVGYSGPQMRTELICRIRGKASEWLSKLSAEQKGSYVELKNTFLLRWQRKRGAIAAVKLSSLRQRRDQDADSFLDECLTTFQDVDLDPRTELAKQYYVGGLRYEIQQATLAHLDKDLEELAEYAAKVEHTVKRAWMGDRSARDQQRQRGDNKREQDTATAKKLTCFHCNKEGHKRYECPELKKSTGADQPSFKPQAAESRRSAQPQRPN